MYRESEFYIRNSSRYIFFVPQKTLEQTFQLKSNLNAQRVIFN